MEYKTLSLITTIITLCLVILYPIIAMWPRKRNKKKAPSQPYNFKEIKQENYGLRYNPNYLTDEKEPTKSKGQLQSLTLDLGQWAQRLRATHPYLKLTIEEIYELQAKIYLLDQYLNKEENHKGDMASILEYEGFIMQDEWKNQESKAIDIDALPTYHRQPIYPYEPTTPPRRNPITNKKTRVKDEN